MAESPDATGVRQESSGVKIEVDDPRRALLASLTELSTERERLLAGLSDMQRDKVAQAGSEDQVDAGTTSFERDRELTIAQGLLDRMRQCEHALARIDAGTYGLCERCGRQIPAARLDAFPSVTLCVSCKSLEERR